MLFTDEKYIRHGIVNSDQSEFSVSQLETRVTQVENNMIEYLIDKYERHDTNKLSITLIHACQITLRAKARLTTFVPSQRFPAATLGKSLPRHHLPEGWSFAVNPSVHFPACAKYNKKTERVARFPPVCQMLFHNRINAYL